MKKFAVAMSLMALSVTAVSADGHVAGENAVKARQAIMWANGDAGAIAGALLKGELDYNPLLARAALKTMRAGAHSMGAFFPEGTMGDNNNASAKIWEDADGWNAAIAKYIEASDAAAAAAGRDGPADLDAFKAAVFPVFGTCNDCHEGYRIKRQ